MVSLDCFFCSFWMFFDESVWFWMFSNVVRYIPGCSLRCKCEVIAKGQDKMGFISSGTKKDKPVELDTHFCWREASWMAKTFRKIPLVATNMRYYTCHSQLSWWSTCLKSSWFLWSLPEFMLRKLPGSASILWDWWEGSWWGWNPLACWTSHHYFILKKMCVFFFFRVIDSFENDFSCGGRLPFPWWTHLLGADFCRCCVAIFCYHSNACNTKTQAAATATAIKNDCQKELDEAATSVIRKGKARNPRFWNHQEKMPWTFL